MNRGILTGIIAAALLGSAAVQAYEKKVDPGEFTPKFNSRPLPAIDGTTPENILSPAEIQEKALDLQRWQQAEDLRLAQQALNEGRNLSIRQKRLIEDAANSVSKGGHVIDEGGPDAFGNTWIMTGDEGGPDYAWVDIPVESRIVAELGDDSFVGPFAMGGALSFYGESYSELYIGSNGFVGFNPAGMGSLGNQDLPAPFDPNLLIAFFWDDLNPSSGGEVYYANLGDTFVVTFDAVPEFGSTETITAQVVINHSENTVFCNYASLSDNLDLASSTTGIENADGTDALQVQFGDASFLQEGSISILFELAPPPDYAHSVTPGQLDFSGGPGDAVSGEITIWNSGLTADSYDLGMVTDQIDFVMSHNGTPVSNTGLMQPAESFLVEISGTIAGDASTYTDAAEMDISSDNSDNVVLVAVTTSVFNAGGGGPDAFGNTWISSSSGDVDYFWSELPPEDRNVLAPGDDWVSAPIPMDGTLSFYGTAYTDIFVSSNGYVGFDAQGMSSLSNQLLPSPNFPNSLISLFWDDLNPGNSGEIYTGTDAEGRFVVTYDAVVEYSSGPGAITAQVVIDFEAQQVFCNYAILSDGIDVLSCTVGIENADGTDGLQVLANGDPGSPIEEWTVRFDLAPPPEYAVIATEQIDVVGAAGGTFTGAIQIINSGSLAETYDLALDTSGSAFSYAIVDDQGTPISILGPLDPLESTEVFIEMTVPEDPPVVEEFITFSVTSQQDEFAMATTQVRGVAVPTAGTDSWGNSWISSLEDGGPAYEWIDLPEESRTYLTFPGGNDSYEGPFEMPEGLSFYGGAYNQFWISAKGFIGFMEEGMATFTNSNIPSDFIPNAQIYVFWDDFAPLAAGQQFFGVDDAGRLVVSWEELPVWPSGPANVTIQAVIDFDQNQIFMNYADFSNDMNLQSCTIGIENEDGTVALPITFDGNPLIPSEELTIRVDLADPPDYWFATSDAEAILGQADETVIATFVVDNVGLAADSYSIFADNGDGFDVWTQINGTPAVVTPTLAAGGSIEVEVAISIPEVPPVANTISTLSVTSNGNSNLSQNGTVLLTIQLVQGGPDTFGNFWSTTDADGQVEFDWITLDNPIVITLGDDDFGGPFDMGLSFNHYGSEYSSVYIGSNGMMGFAPDNMGSLGNSDLPNVNAPNALIAWFWDDLNPNAGGTVSYQTIGEMFVMEFSQVPEFGGTGTITAQVILDNDEEAVRINFLNVETGLDLQGSTIGIENDGGTDGLMATFNGTGWTPGDSSAIWFGLNVIGPSGPYAVAVDPDEITGIGINGGVAEYEIEVENRGENDSSFELEVEANAWDVTFHDVENDWAEITQIPVLTYDEIFLLGVRHFVPEEPASFTDQALVTVSATDHAEAFAEVNILTSASCNHIDQIAQNLTGPGLFGMTDLSDGEWIGGTQVIWNASGVNRMVILDTEDGTVGPITALPFGPDYQGIAMDNRDGSYWLSVEGGVVHVDDSGSVLGEFDIALLAPAANRDARGLAYDADHEILWAICNHGGTDDLVRIDVSNADAPVGLTASMVPWSVPFGSGAAGLDYHEESDQLLALNAATGDVECFLDLLNGDVDARGDFCPSGLGNGHGLALTADGNVFLGATNGLAHPVEHYQAPCDFGVVSVGLAELPVSFELGANHPNPFNPSTIIGYALPVGGHVQLDVYNLLGQHQMEISNGMRPAGWHEVRFDGSQLSSGVYFYRITISSNGGAVLFTDVRKMMLMK